MGIEKTKWRELGLTPRQLSKKMGVTCSMAEFIAQSYRVPLSIQGPQVTCACSPCKRASSKKKVKCVCNAVSPNKCKNVPDLPVFPAPCCRKRKSEEEPSDPEDSPAACAWKKEVHESASPSCCDSQPSTCNRDNCYKISTTTCYSRPSPRKRYKASPHRKPRCVKGKRKAKPRRKATMRPKGRKRATRSKKFRRVPLTLCLKLPVNIYLDEKDGMVIDKEALPCVQCQATCSTSQEPPLVQECVLECPKDNCEEPRPGRGTPPPPEVEMEMEEECPEDTDTEESVPSEKGCCAEEKDDCSDEPIVVKETRHLSWWESFQECVAYLESFLCSLVNKY